MKNYSKILFIVLFLSCKNYGELKVIASLPKTLKEVSGTEVVANSKLIWMLNDSGNSSKLYGVSLKGTIKKEVKIASKNNDWEDIASDAEGNIYIGDFGNNDNKRKNLAILKVNFKDISAKDKVLVEKIKFSYPNQTKFPPKKKERFFDAEAFFYWKNNFYIFTKSRVKSKYGKTSLYKIPALPGDHTAEFIATFTNCNNTSCQITSADISNDGRNVVLLTHNELLIFSNYKNDNFFKGTLAKFPLKYDSQKEGVSFKNDSLCYITDERSKNKGGLLYQFNFASKK